MAIAQAALRRAFEHCTDIVSGRHAQKGVIVIANQLRAIGVVYADAAPVAFGSDLFWITLTAATSHAFATRSTQLETRTPGDLIDLLYMHTPCR